MRACFACVAASALLGAVASADSITFNDLSLGTVVTNQYSSATFSSISGQDNVVTNYTTNMICTYDTGGDINCTKPTFVDFTNPVNNLTFIAIEPNEFGVVSTIRIFENYVYTADFNFTGLGGGPNQFGYGEKLVDLSAYSNVTRIEILGPGGVGDLDNSYGGNGIGWDTFCFDVVPAPGAGALLALSSVLALLRRRV